MPATRKININRITPNSPQVVFSPANQQALAGDVISWANNDPSLSHWPAPKDSNGVINQTGFMSQAIPPNASSLQSFSPDAAGTVNYVCALHTTEIGAIDVLSGPPAVLPMAAEEALPVAPTAVGATTPSKTTAKPKSKPKAKSKPKPKPKPKPKSKAKPKPKPKSKPKSKPPSKSTGAKSGSKSTKKSAAAPKAKRPPLRFAIVEWVVESLMRVPALFGLGLPRWRHAFAGASLGLTLAFVGTAYAQPQPPAQPAAPQPQPAGAPAFVQCAPFGKQPLIKIPEIKRDDATGILRAVLVTADEQRNLWFKNGASFFCSPQYLRYFKGYRPGHPEDWKVNDYKVSGLPEPLPGPTLRARVGDLIQITFLNQIQTKDFGNSIDRAEMALGCDETKSLKGPIYPGSDTMPNCVHGSSTSNLHFHGTHTTPSTTGDNVLIQVRPSLRKYPPEPNGKLVVTEDVVRKPFGEFFKSCEVNGSPSRWDQMPKSFRELQMGKSTTKPGGWIGEYDKTAAYKPSPLWPPNQELIEQGLWPAYFIGAFPYCFRVPDYDPKKVKMGQAPGTHWYHAHKHGSTDINVANGMTGALIIEGDYDHKLRDYYKNTTDHKNWELEEQVLVIQQLSPVPNILSGSAGGPAALSVNGRQLPIVKMRPGQVQLWRFVNGASRNMVSLCPVTGLPWRQTAQDGVQFSPPNYTNVGKQGARIDLAAANRADLLVQAPTATGDYTLTIVAGVATPSATACASAKTTLLTVNVDGSLPAAQPQMPFIDEVSFPKHPDFLKDIPASEIRYRRELVFATVPNPNPNPPPPASRTAPPGNSHYIDNRQFGDHRVDQSMLLDTVEEWKVLNLTTAPGPIFHPFHIHVNPFQITEVFDPNVAPARPDCAVDPAKPETWKPCSSPTKDFVWWDVFAIPAGREDTLPTSVCTVKQNCPEAIRDIVRCADGTCKVTIPGYFKMRSRFADYPGQFVLHCHILVHEDRGMMQLVQVVPNTTLQPHH